MTKVTLTFVALFVMTQPQERCNDQLRIETCSNDPKKVTLVIQAVDNLFTAEYDSDCPHSSLKYQWLMDGIVVEESSEERQHYVLKAETFDLGNHELRVEIEVVREGGDVETFQSNCFLKIKPIGMQAVITGGDTRTVEEDRSFVMDGSESIDYDKEPNESGKMQYEWSCQVLRGKVKSFCQKKYSGSTLRVPANYALANYEYFFTLKVKLSEDANWVKNANQTVIVQSLEAQLKITCRKNCSPKTDSQKLTHLRVSCIKNCRGLDDKSYRWTVDDAAFDYDTMTQFGRYSDKFIIKEGVLEPGVTYTISVAATGGRQGQAVIKLTVHAPIKIHSCTVIPGEGKASSTVFTVACSYSGKGHTFEIFTKREDKTVPLTTATQIGKLSFLLPADIDVYIKIQDQEASSDVYKLEVQVKSDISLADLGALLDDLSKEKSLTVATQMANIIIEELEKQPSENNAEIRRTILRNFVETPITTQMEARQVYSVVSRLVYNPSEDSDPYRGALATGACRKGADVDLKHLRNRHYARNMAAEIKKNTEILMKCGVTDTKANFKNLEKKPLSFNITTPFPVLSLPMIGEQYEDYDSDDDAANKAKKYEEASKNYVDICQIALKMMALTVVEGEDTTVSASDNVSAQITRLEGRKLVQTEIKIDGASFWASKDLEMVSEAVDVMVCSWGKDPFWWNPSGRAVSTNVVLVKLTRNGKELVKFEQPFLFVLDSMEVVLRAHLIDGVVRIDVKKGEAFFIEVDAVEPFQVLLSDFEKPTEAEVAKKGKTVNKGKTLMFQEHDHEYDGWHYLSAVPMVPFRIKVYTVSCYSWNFGTKTWDFACKASVNSTPFRIQCLCNHLSILAGVVYNNPIKIDRVTTEPDFDMVLQSCPIIFGCVGAIFTIYCFLLVFLIKEQHKQGFQIYLPADISSSARYLYLVGIRTGRKANSGTSSNICIKIYGDQNSSRSHVLNYPDPQKRIFQWGNLDWFAIPTVYCLGDLAEVALWSDYSGRKPQWFCNHVTIRDVQKEERWEFKVDRWFDLPPTGQVYFKIQVLKNKVKTKVFGSLLFRFFSKRSHQAGLGRLKKLSILVSIFMTIFFSALVMLGLPRMTLNDGFDRDSNYVFYPEITGVSFANAFFSLLRHIALTFAFRKTKTWGWLALVVNITATTIGLIIYGFWIPPIAGYLWLTTAGIASIIYFFFLENIYENIWSISHRNEEPMWRPSEVLETLEVQRKYLFAKFGEDLLRPYFQHLYQPLDIEDIQDRRENVASRYKILTLLEDTVMFSCYIALLYLAIFANRNPMAVLNHNEMENLVWGQTRIQSLAEFYSYANDTLVPALHLGQWYASFVVKEPGTMADYNSKFLGVARIRQQRTTLQPCPKVGFLKLNTCRPEFWYSEENLDHFGPDFNDLARLSQIWNYTESQDSGLTLHVGKFGIYSGGGFIAPLGRTLYNSFVNLNYLWENRWLDEATSVIFIEFLTYNVNTNLFNAVTVMVERSSTGFFRTKTVIDTIQLLFVKDEENNAQIVILTAFVLVVVIFTIKILVRLVQGRFVVVLADLWILIDLAIVGLSYGCFGVTLYRSGMVKAFLDQMEKAKKNEFINYFHLVHAETVFTLVAALLVFISTIRLWKLCRFGTVFRIMERTVQLCIVPVCATFFYHVVALVAFSFTSFLVFGATFSGFKDIPDSLVSLMRLSTRLIGTFNIDELLFRSLVLGNILFIAYMFLNLLFFNFYITAIILSYYKAQKTTSTDFADLKHFLGKEIEYQKASAKIVWKRLKAGGSKRQSLITPKADEFRYENCLVSSTGALEMMRCAALNHLKTDVDKFRLMFQVVGCFGDRRNELFFSGIRQRVVRVVHDGKIQRVALAAHLIVNYDERRRQRYRKAVEQQLNKLDYMSTALDTVLNIVSNIDIE